MSEDVKSRREAIGAIAIGAGGLIAGSAAAQTKPQVRRLNKAKAVMPDGSQLDRAQVLSKLGLDPTTPPDAWLTVIGCGSNASALRPDQLKALVRSKRLNPAMLDSASRRKIGL